MALTKRRTRDQYDLEGRLERLIHEHLLDMEERPSMQSSKDRLATIQYVGMFLNRKFGWGETGGEDVGSSVRKYARAAFQTPPYAVGGRATGGRSARPVPVDTSRNAHTDTDDEDAA